MPVDTTFTIEGMDEFIDTIDKMIEGIKPDKIEPVLDKAAGKIAREVRARAPVGPTGNLKKAVKKKKLLRWFGSPSPYIVAIDRKKAPHAWLVVHGTSGVRKVDPPQMVKIGGQPALITQTGVMPPNRFFAEGIEAKQGEALSIIEKGVEKILGEAMK